MSGKDNNLSFSLEIKDEIIAKLMSSKNETKLQAAKAGMSYSSDVDAVLIGDPTDPDFRRYFLRGVFLECGYCSDPRKTYRIELHIKNPAASEIVTEILDKESLPYRTSVRDNTTVIYINNGDAVSDIMGMMGADGSRLKFENIRAERELYGSVNRTMNCDSGNTRRQAEAGAVRNELISKLMASDKARELPGELQEAARVHLENPGASIAELGKMMDPPIGKSGMNHRLTKLIEIAKGLD